MNRVLYIRHGQSGPNLSGVFAGGQDNTPLTNLARELAEEVGIKNVKLQEIGTYFTGGKYHDRILRRFNKVYKVTGPVDTKLALQADEVSDAKWFTIDEVRDLIKNRPDQVSDGLVDVFERFY